MLFLMKTLATIIPALVVVLTSLGFTNRTSKPVPAGPTYITVSYTNTSNKVYTYWGGGLIDEARIKGGFFGENEYKNKIVEVLNSLHEKGYEVIATDHFVYHPSVGSEEKEYNYTLKLMVPQE